MRPSLPRATFWIRSALAATVAGVVWTAVHQTRPDLQLVRAVQFDGAVRSGQGELRHLADVRNGTRLWEIDSDRVAANVERHPWVKDATAVLSLDGTLSVSVEEYHPVAVLHADRAYYLDPDGTPFLAATGTDLDYPQITGLHTALSSMHPDLPVLAVSDALSLLNELDARGLVALDNVSELNFSSTRGWTVHTGPSVVVFGLGAHQRQLDRLSLLITRQGVSLDEPTFVDLAPNTVAIVRSLGLPSDG